MKTKIAMSAGLSLCLLALSGCGGGGGGGTGGAGGGGDGGGGGAAPVSSQLDFPLRALYESRLIAGSFSTATVAGRFTSGVTFTGNATLNEVALTQADSWAYINPGLNTTTTVNARSYVETVAVNYANFSDGSGAQSSTDITTYYFDDQLVRLGWVSGATQALVTSGGQFPATARVGNSGQLETLSLYNAPRGGFAISCGTQTTTWTMLPETESSAILRLTTVRDVTGIACGSDVTSVNNFRVTTGASLRISTIASSQNQERTFTW
jgi:hypothetical protein